jgi:hypothetical protein
MTDKHVIRFDVLLSACYTPMMLNSKEDARGTVCGVYGEMLVPLAVQAK